MGRQCPATGLGSLSVAVHAWDLLKVMGPSKCPLHTLLYAVPPNLQQATADPCLCWRLLDTHGQVWVNLFWGHCSFLLGPSSYKGFVHPPRVCFPVLGKFWQLYGGVNDDLLQEGLCHTQVYCTQSPCPCSSPLLTHVSTGNTQTQFCLSLCGVSGSWYT